MNKKDNLRLLSPKKLNNEQSKEYIDILEKLKERQKIEKDANNIAIAGGYGSGKSSIARTFIEKNKKNRKRAIVIRIGSFLKPAPEIANKSEINNEKIQSEETEEENKKTEKGKFYEDSILSPTEEEITDKIEKSIIKQIVYRLKYKDSRLSEINRPDGKWKIKYTIFSILIMYFICIMLLIGINNSVVNLLNENIILFNNKLNLENITNNITIQNISILLFFGIFLYGIYAIAYQILIKIRLSKIKVKVKDYEFEEINNNREKFKFIDQLYEILYFFINSDVDIVFFEDIDRFGKDICLKVIEDLKELNSILNSSEELKKDIMFVYSFKDSIYDKKEDRSKFYDYIVPVMPISSSYNSYINLTNMLDKENVLKEIDPELIRITSNHIIDMRTLITIVNDYLLFKKILGVDSYNKIFAMCVYKNYYVTDYDNILNDDNKIEKEFLKYKDYIKKLKDECVDKIKIEENKRDTIIVEVMNNRKTLKEILVFKNADHQYMPTHIVIGNETYPIDNFYKEDFDMSLLEEDKVLFLVNGYSKSIKYTEFGNKDEFISKYNNIGVLEKEIINKKIEELNIKKENLNKIIFSSVIKEIYEKEKNSIKKEDLLLLELLMNKYIENDYIDYITAPVIGHKLTGSDSRFIFNVKHKKENNNVRINNVETILKYIQKDLTTPYVLNYSFIEELFRHKKYNELTIVISQFQSINISHLKFLYDYSNSYNDKYLELERYLGRISTEIWNSFVSLDTEIVPEYMYEMILSLVLQEELKIENLNNKTKLIELINKYGTSDCIKLYNSNIKKILEELNLKIEDLEKYDEQDKKYLITNEMYAINVENILEALDGHELTTLKELYDYNEGKKCIQYIKKNPDEFGINIYNEYYFIKIDDKKDIDYFLTHSKREDFIEEILAKEEFKTKKENIDVKFLSIAYEKNHLVIDWNLINYYYSKDNNILPILIKIINDNAEKLFDSDEIKNITCLDYNLVLSILKELYSKEEYKKTDKVLSNYLFDDYKYQNVSTKIRTEELEQKVKYNLINFTKQSYLEVKKKCSKSYIYTYITNWYKDRKYTSISKLLNLSEIKEYLLCNSKVSTDDKISIINELIKNKIISDKKIEETVLISFNRKKWYEVVDRREYRKNIIGNCENIIKKHEYKDKKIRFILK